MRARERLRVVLGVPVAVKHDDRISRNEVDALSARARGEQKQERPVGFVSRAVLGAAEAIDGGLSRATGDASVETLVGVSPASRIVLEHVEYSSHLAEDQHAVTPAFESRQQLVEEL